MPYDPTYPYFLMFVYIATISKTLEPVGSIQSQLTFRLGWNFTYKKVSDHVTNDLKASQLTSYDHPLILKLITLQNCIS